MKLCVKLFSGKNLPKLHQEISTFLASIGDSELVDIAQGECCGDVIVSVLYIRNK